MDNRDPPKDATKQTTVAEGGAGAGAVKDDDSSLPAQAPEMVEAGDGSSSTKDTAAREARKTSTQESEKITVAKWRHVYEQRKGAANVTFTKMAAITLLAFISKLNANASQRDPPRLTYMSDANLIGLASKSVLNPAYVKCLEMKPLPVATAAAEAKKTPTPAAAEKNGPPAAPSPGTAGKTDCDAQKQKQLLIDKTRTILSEHTLPGAREAHIQDLYDYAPTLLRCDRLSLTKERMRSIIRHQWAEHTAEEQRLKSRVAADDWAGRQKQREGMRVSLKRPASPGDLGDRPMKRQFRGPKA